MPSQGPRAKGDLGDDASSFVRMRGCVVWLEEQKHQRGRTGVAWADPNLSAEFSSASKAPGKRLSRLVVAPGERDSPPSAHAHPGVVILNSSSWLGQQAGNAAEGNERRK